MHSVALILIVLASFGMGIVSLLGYIIWRMMRNNGWKGDKSNVHNALRVLEHTILHTEDLGEMFYITPDQQLQIGDVFPAMTLKKPFWYVKYDEFETVVDTRPPKQY